MSKRARSPTPVLNALPPMKRRVLPTHRLTRHRNRNRIDNNEPAYVPYTRFKAFFDSLETSFAKMHQQHVDLQNQLAAMEATLAKKAERKETCFSDLPQELRLMIFNVAANNARAKWFRRKRRAILRNLEMPDSWGFTPAGNTEIILTGHHKWSISEASVGDEVQLYVHDYYPREVILEIESGLPTGLSKLTEVFVTGADEETYPVDPDDPIEEYWIDVMF